MKAAFYVVFHARVVSRYSPEHRENRPVVTEVKPVRMTLKPPSLASGEMYVAYSTDIPDSAFVRMMPSAEVEVPDGWWTSMPVRVVVAEPPEGPA